MLNNMKNFKSKIIFAVMLIMGISAFVGCEKGQIEAPKSEENTKVLFESLKQFNLDFTPSKINSNSSPKGFWSSVGEVCKVAGADIIGAGTCVWATKELAAAAGCCTGGTGAAVVAGASAVIGGAGASYAASGIKLKGSNPVGGLSNINLPVEYYYLSNVGVFHNSFINDVYYGNILETNWIRENYTSDSTCVLGFVQNTQWIEIKSLIYSSFVDYSANNYNYLQILNYFKDINYINSNIKNVLESYMEVYLTATSFEDIDNISNFYISEVSNSSLTEIEKEALLCSFLVGANSPHFWLQSE